MDARPPEALDEQDMRALEALLDALPPPCTPLDLGALDGYLCGVLLQPVAQPPSRWMPHALDEEGRPPPPGHDVRPLQALILRRHAELDHAISRRRWFDPWIFELDDAHATPSLCVSPWVAGFALATEVFPALLQLDAEALTEPLALLFRHLDPDDLEDADALLEEIETLEPPEDLSVAVEELVRATLLIADVSRPMPRPQPRPARRRGGQAPRPYRR